MNKTESGFPHVKEKINENTNLKLEFSEIKKYKIKSPSFRPLFKFKQNEIEIPTGIFVFDSTKSGENEIYIFNSDEKGSPIHVVKWIDGEFKQVDEIMNKFASITNIDALTIVENKRKDLFNYLVSSKDKITVVEIYPKDVKQNSNSDISLLGIGVKTENTNFYIPGMSFFVAYEDNKKMIMRSQNGSYGYPSLRPHKESAGLGLTNLIINNIYLRYPLKLKSSLYNTPDASGFPNTYILFSYKKEKFTYKLYFFGKNYQNVIYGAAVTVLVFLVIFILLSYRESKLKKDKNKIGQRLLDAL